MMATAVSLVNFIMADDGFSGLSDDTKSKVEQYIRNPNTGCNELTTNTSCGTRNQPEIDINIIEHSTSNSEAKFLDLQKEIDAVNEQFKNSLIQRHNLMLHNETLLKNLHEVELKEKMTKVDNGILQLKIDSLTESLLKCKNKLSDLHSKYYNEINTLRPNLNQKEAEVLVLKNDVNLLQIKCKNQENTLNIMKQVKKESANNQRFKECYENQLEETKRLKIDLVESRGNVSKLTSSLNEVEKKFSILSNDHQQYKTATEHTLFVLKNKLNASEEIVKQLLLGNSDNLNNLIQTGTTMTDIYAVYKETCLNLQDTTLELEKSKINFNLLEEEIRNTAPIVDKMEEDLIESKEKINQLNKTISIFKLMLEDVNNKLELSNTKCDNLSKKNEKLQGSVDDMSKQICFLLRNNQNNTRLKNENIGMDMSPQLIISNNYVTFENIKGLQKQNKKLLEMIRSLSKSNDEQDIKLIKDLKDKLQNMGDKLETQEQLISQQKEKIAQMQCLEFKSKLFTQLNDDEQNEVQTFNTTILTNDDGAVSCQLEKHREYLYVVHELHTAYFTINQLKEQLKSNSVAHKQLDHHVKELNSQINELLGKIKTSNIKHSENVENVDNLQCKILSLETENQEVKIEINKVEIQCNILKNENNNIYISNTNYCRELGQIAELQKEFENILTSQLNSLIINWNLKLAYIVETDYDKVKFIEEYNKLTKTLKDVRNTLILKLEAINDLSTFKEISRSRTNVLSLCTDERSIFQSAVSKLEYKVTNMISKLNESDELTNQLKSELNITNRLNKSLERNLKKMHENSLQLENECEIKNKECFEKDQKLRNVMQQFNKLNLSKQDNSNKLQKQLLDYELKYNTILEELGKAKDHRDQLLQNNSKQCNTILTLEKEFKKSVHEKDQLEKFLNHKLAYYNNKLEVLDALELFNTTKSAEIDDLKNQKMAIEKSTKEIKEMHEMQLKNLYNEINGLKETIKRVQFENEHLLEQNKTITFELINQEQLNNSKKSNKGDSCEILDEENVLLTSQLKEFEEIDAKKTAEICALKDEVSRMQNLIDQKTAEIVSLTKDLVKWKEQSTHSESKYKSMLSTLETEKLEMTTTLDKLKSTKSKELFEKPETDFSEKIIKLKSKMVTNNKVMETLKNSIKSYRQKLSDVASEIYNVKVSARHYKHQCEELNNVLCTERRSWQNKFDELLQQGGSKISLDECKKLIEQGKQEQKAECELIINEHKAKALDANAGLNAAKIEVQVVKTKSEDKEMHAKQLFHQVRGKIQNLTRELDTTKKQRDGLIARLNEAERNGGIDEIQVHIARMELENQKLITEKEQITAEKDCLTHTIQMLNHRLTALMRQFSNQQGSKSTLTVSNSNETTVAQVSPATSVALVVLQDREQVQTTVSQPTTVSVSTTSPSQSQKDRYSIQNKNGQAIESCNRNIASPSAPGPLTKSKQSVVTACSSELSGFSLYTTTDSNSTQRKRKANILVTSYTKRYNME